MNIYESIATRTNGDIYVGVVGPVRTGKSTFITKFMEKIVLPKLNNTMAKERTKDELPQSGEGRLIMTMQPRFVPSEAVEVALSDNAKARIRMVDCVGYLIDGVQGHMENDKPRLVKTPWQDEKMPFEKAAEIGTSKVINEHSTIGILVTTDGTVTDIPRKNYIKAEERVVEELKALKKPFIILLNTKTPQAEETKNLAKAMEAGYGVPTLVSDIENLNENEFLTILERVLFEFPVKQVKFKLPEWMRNLPYENENITNIMSELAGLKLDKMSEYVNAFNLFKGNEDIISPYVEEINLGTGDINYMINASQALFYKTLSNMCGEKIGNDYDLINYVADATVASKEYKKLASALENVEKTGYGVVMPGVDEMELGSPEVVKKAGNSGVKLRAKASTLHIMKIDVETEVTPAVGGAGLNALIGTSEEQQIDEETQKQIWDTNMFGKSLSELAHDGIVTKIQNFPEEAQIKMRKTLSKITNEGRGGIICILL